MNEQLLYKRIIEWDEDKLVLDDGSIVTIELTEADCCADAGGTFSNVVLDAVITNVEVKEYDGEPDDDGMTTNDVVVTLYHNQNPIAQADAFAHDGNCGYYYSVGSFVIKDIHYPIVRA